MCDGFSEAAMIASAVAAVGSAAGSAYSAVAQGNAAKAQQQANDQAISAQNASFWSRNASQNLQIQQQGAAQQQAMAQQEAVAQQQQAAQSSAMQQQQAVVNAENQQSQNITSAADKVQSGLLQQTSGQSLSDAQAAELASRTAGTDQIANQLQAGSALSTATPGSTNPDSSTSQAFASAMAQSAANVRSYGQKLAQVASYTAPLTTVGQSITNAQTGIMPIQQAQQLLSSGSSARLLPGQLAYSQAGSEGDTAQGAISSNLQQQLDLANNRYQGDTGVATLTQQDADTLAQNNAQNAKSQAAAASTLGGLISSVGNLAAYGAGRYGNLLNGTQSPNGPGANGYTSAATNTGSTGMHVGGT